MRTSHYYSSVLLIFILIGGTAPAHSDERLFSKIISPEKSINSSSYFVFVKGRWKKSEGSDRIKMNKPPRINTVDIVCDKEAMNCLECIAQLVTAKDMGMIAGMEIAPMLTIETTLFRIIDWSDETIIAKASFLPSDYTLRISVKDNHAERRRQETKARGDMSADPNIYEKWLLE